MNGRNSLRFVVKHIGWSLEKAIAKPKPAKELAYPTARADRNNAAIMDELTREINNETPTRNIRKPGDVGNLNFCTFTQNCNGLIRWSFEIPAYAYCQPLCVIIENLTTNKE